MPLPAGPCDNCPPDCTVLYEVVASVVQVAYEAVACLLNEELCSGFTGFVSHAEPNHPDGDYVAAWLARLTPRDRNQSTSAGLMLPIPTADVGLKLCETGYPTVDGDGFPSFEEMTNAALHSYSHAEAMIRAVYANVGRGSRDRILRDCGWQGMSALIPSRPSGGLAAWSVTVSLQVPGW